MYSYNDIRDFVYKYPTEGIIVDTEVFCLLLLGKYDADLIEKNPLTKGRFFRDDIEILDNILYFFKRIIVTPFVISELSNWSRKHIKEPILSRYLQSTIHLLEKAGEATIPLNDLLKVDLTLVSRFGFTDMAMFKISEAQNVPVITVDVPFFTYSIEKIPIINFTNIRASEGRSK